MALSRLSRSFFGGSFRRPYRGEEGPLGPLDTGKRLGAWSPFHRSHQLGHRLTHPDHPPWAPSTSAQPTGQIFSGACGLPAAGNGVKRAQTRKRMSVTFRGSRQLNIALNRGPEFYQIFRVISLQVTQRSLATPNNGAPLRETPGPLPKRRLPAQERRLLVKTNMEPHLQPRWDGHRAVAPSHRAICQE